MKDFLRKTREHLHKHPELALEEYQTAKYIRDFLTSQNIQYEAIGTSTLALFEGVEDVWIGFRADIDALPLKEENEKPYKSEVEGRMHACGHDGHTTNLLYFAKWIKSQIDSGKKLKKSVMLIFQAGEEGKGGARFIADSPIFSSKKFEGIFGMHLMPEIPQGKVAIARGALSFQNINVDLEITGKGCHGAQPHKGIDSILVGAKLVEAYQSIVSRNIDPTKTVIFTIGSFKAGEVRNIIPEKVKMLGTIRLADVSLIEPIRERVVAINEGMERAYGVHIDMNFMPFYPPVINSDKLYEVVESVLEEDRIVRDVRLTGSEDFSFYLQKGNPGFMFLLGSRNEEKGYTYPLHSPKFDFDTDVLEVSFDVFSKVLEKMGAF